MDTRASRGRIACGAALIVLALAGCGGGSKSLSKPQFVARANAACSRANAKVSALPAPASGLTGVADYAAKLQPIAAQLVSDLRALDAPEALRAPFQQYVSQLNAAVAKLPQLGAAAKRGDAQNVQRLSAAIGSRPTDRLATQLGLSACAEHPAPRAS